MLMKHIAIFLIGCFFGLIGAVANKICCDVAPLGYYVSVAGGLGFVIFLDNPRKDFIEKI